jgi:epoxyqueuosine reductase
VTLQEILKHIENRQQEWNFSHFGWARLERPLSFSIYQDWISQGKQGDMSYLKDHAPIKEDATRKWPRARSAFVFAQGYFPHPEKAQNFPLDQARLSLYSQGADYHQWFKEKMDRICIELRSFFPDDEFFPMTDSSPVLERDLAYRAGLGWVGKNTCLIHPKKGSLFFIGEIYSSLDFSDQKAAPVPDFCGTCTRCLDICPTGALTAPRDLDARKCISYLTIESRSVAEESLRAKIGDWFFGCDLCQTICPWNQKAFKNQLTTALNLEMKPDAEKSLEEDLRYILTASGKQLTRDFAATSLSRSGSFGLKRNALFVIGNRRIKALQKEVQGLLEHDKLGELASWTIACLEKLKDPAS